MALLAAALLAGVTGRVAAEVGEAAARRQIEVRFDVDVLRSEAGEIDGIPVWLMTVMNRGGDFNSAFQVNVLAVDRRSGELVPAFRHRSSGYDLPAGRLRGGKVDRRPDTGRSQTWR